MAPHSSTLAWKIPWRSLVGCSPWGRKESGKTERLHFHFSFSCIGEGNGNRLQCSCLENPRDEGAWWAAVYGVAQSRTRLKRHSSSSSSRDIMYSIVTVVNRCCCQWPSGFLLSATPWIVACQPPLSLEFSMQEYWIGLPCRPPGHLPHPGIEPASPAQQADSLPLSHQGSAQFIILYCICESS